MDETAAKGELNCLSANAKLWLEDRIGNGLAAMVGFSSIGMAAKVEESSDKLLSDLSQVGLF